MEWSEFARRLGRELAGLERDTILIVRERDESRHYVQAMREPDRLYAEAVSNNFLEGPLLLTTADEEIMSDVGWRPPADPAPRNWWTELPEFGTPGGMLSVAEGDFSRLADVMVTALRDVQGVRRPSDLVYESFHRHGTGLIELTDFGIDVADPSRVNKRRAASRGASGHPFGEQLPETGPPPAAAPPAATPTAAEGLPRVDADPLEPRLAEAKANGDNTTYFKLLANADLVLPATAPAVEDPERAEFPTITIGSSTYVTVFTSPAALARTGDRHPGLYRRTTFAQLASGWPDPTWRLAINWGLPSEVLLDSSVITRMLGNSGAAPSLAPDVPNPYGTVNPNALSGPNPVVGGMPPTVNGSSHGIDHAYDESHTAIDPYTIAELNAALDADTTHPNGFSPEPVAPEPVAAEPVPAEPVEAEPVEAEPVEAEPVAGEPVAAEPVAAAEPAAPELAEPKAAVPEAAAALPLGAPTRKNPVDGPARRSTGIPIRPPHGARLWRSTGEGDDMTLAVYDAIGGVWAPVRTDAVPAPRTE